MSRVRTSNSIQRFFTIAIVILLCAAPFQDLRAQGDDYTTHIVKWYEDIYSIASEYGMSAEIIMVYNGLEEMKVERRQVLRIPKNPQNVDLKGLKKISPKDTEPKDTHPQEAVSDDKTPSQTVRPEVSGNPHHVMPAVPMEAAMSHISIALSIPLHNAAGINGPNYDFYSGALLAIRNLSSEGISVDLHVTDTHEGLAEPWILNGCQIAIGPLAKADMDSTLRSCTSPLTTFISPLDSRTASLALKDERFIQAPSGADAQNEDVVEWIREELTPDDRVTVFTEAGMQPSSLLSVMAASGIPYSVYTYDIVNGRQIEENLAGRLTDKGTNRILIASDREAFVNDVVRNLKLMIHRELDVILYSTSKIRGFETIDEESLHDVRLKVSTSYYIDYDSPKVMSFLMAYRALFGAEPGPFAFQGYDTMYNFASMLSMYGEGWKDALCNVRQHGLQSDFMFDRSVGLSNRATRRLVYGDEYQIKYLR